MLVCPIRPKWTHKVLWGMLGMSLSGESDIQSDVGVPGMSVSAESDIQSGLRTVMMSDSGESVTWG